MSFGFVYIGMRILQSNYSGKCNYNTIKHEKNKWFPTVFSFPEWIVCVCVCVYTKLIKIFCIVWKIFKENMCCLVSWPVLYYVAGIILFCISETKTLVSLHLNKEIKFKNYKTKIWDKVYLHVIIPEISKLK